MDGKGGAPVNARMRWTERDFETGWFEHRALLSPRGPLQGSPCQTSIAPSPGGRPQSWSSAAAFLAQRVVG